MQKADTCIEKAELIENTNSDSTRRDGTEGGKHMQILKDHTSSGGIY